MFIIVVVISAIGKHKLGNQKTLVTNHDTAIKNKANLYELQKAEDVLSGTGQKPDSGKLQTKKPAFLTTEILRKKTRWRGTCRLK